MTSLPSVRDLMDRKPVKLRPDMRVAAAIEILLEQGITGAAVVDHEDRVLGLLTDKECLRTLLREAYEHMPTGLVSEYMLPDAPTCSPDTDLFTLTERFVGLVQRRLLVVENGKLIGQITRRDLLRAIQRYWR